MQEETIRTTTMQNPEPPPSDLPPPPQQPPTQGDSPQPPFFAILNALIEKNGGNVADIARRSGIPYSTLLSWTKKDSDEGLKLVARLPQLAKELGTTTGALFGDPVPVPETRGDQVEVRRGGWLIDDVYREIADEGGTLPRGRTWAFEIRPSVRVATKDEEDKIAAALKAKGKRR